MSAHFPNEDSTRVAASRLVLVDLDDPASSRFLAFDDLEDADRAIISPDQTTIFFEGKSRLRGLVDVATGEITKPTYIDFAGVAPAVPMWHPDSEELVFGVSGGFVPATDLYGYDVTKDSLYFIVEGVFELAPLALLGADSLLVYGASWNQQTQTALSMLSLHTGDLLREIPHLYLDTSQSGWIHYNPSADRLTVRSADSSLVVTDLDATFVRRMKTPPGVVHDSAKALTKDVIMFTHRRGVRDYLSSDVRIWNHRTGTVRPLLAPEQLHQAVGVSYACYY
ncbi:MAG: hypothetical protein AAF970_16995 [Bacteroidota bacterium]